MVSFLKEIAPTLGTPSTILIISAHWEEEIVSITSAKRPSLIYDYYGFPEESYAIEYPAAGDPELAEKIYWLLRDDGIEAKLDDSRGFDHGVFVPLKIMFPEANIPCVQLSLLNSLSAESHLQIGKALSELRHENMLVIGSGFSFHNMKALMSQSKSGDNKNEEFERWLIDTCTNPYLLPTERDTRLIEWTNAPFARYCHPREEHLLPLHVCMGMTEGIVAGKKTSSFLWN
jgi:aromatic ring-opening dioxygenase catalytic subunit (LigB family)